MKELKIMFLCIDIRNRHENGLFRVKLQNKYLYIKKHVKSKYNKYFSSPHFTCKNYELLEVRLECCVLDFLL